MEKLKELSLIYKKAQELILASNNQRINEIKPYALGDIIIEENNEEWGIWETVRKSINEPIIISLCSNYINYVLSEEEPLSKKERVFTALHELIENAQLTKDYSINACPTSNYLTGILLNGTETPQQIKDYVHTNWGLLSYLPTIKNELGKIVIDFTKELSNKFEITLDKAYIFLRTNTLLSFKISRDFETTKKYVNEIK